MARLGPAEDHELTEEQRRWRLQFDEKRRLNINQIEWRMRNRNSQLHPDPLTPTPPPNAPTSPTDPVPPEQQVVSVEQFVELARTLQNKAPVDDIISVLHAQLVLYSQHLELRPQDFVPMIKMLKEIEADQSGEATDPYRLVELDNALLCDRLLEGLHAAFQVWMQTYHHPAASSMLPVIDEWIHMVFLHEPYDGHPRVASIAAFLLDQGEPEGS